MIPGFVHAALILSLAGAPAAPQLAANVPPAATSEGAPATTSPLLVAAAPAPGGAAAAPGSAMLPSHEPASTAPGDATLVAANDPTLVAANSSMMASSFPPPAPSVEAALPPAPTIIVRQTKMFGTVTINHTAHLQRRTPCAACHGPGPVHKIEFTPKLAHDRCRGCHVEKARGPTDCRGCHVVPQPAPTVAAAPKPMSADEPAAGTPEGKAADAAAAAPGSGPGGKSVTPIAAATPSAGGVVPASATSAVASAAEPLGVFPPTVAENGISLFSRTAEFGLATVFGDDGAMVGPSFKLVGRSGAGMVSYTMTVPGGLTGDGRTQFLLGLGGTLQLKPYLRASCEGIGGVDAFHRDATTAGAFGIRVGAEILSGVRYARTVIVSMTAIRDFFGGTQVYGQQNRDLTVGFTIGTGVLLPNRNER